MLSSSEHLWECVSLHHGASIQPDLTAPLCKTLSCRSEAAKMPMMNPLPLVACGQSRAAFQEGCCCRKNPCQGCAVTWSS